jgi:peptidoglycan/LPS O-acetylase OafA/YrhL
MEFVEALNGFRGFAFINVLIDHYYWTSGCVIDIGQFGLGMFFVLSAYLLTGQLYKQYMEKNTINFLNYWVRRFFRIYPVLILALIVEYYTQRLNNKQIEGIFFLTGIVGFYWAIYLEMRFYVIIPLIVYIFAKIKNLYYKFLTMFIITILGFCYHFYLNFLVDDPRGFRRWDIDDFSFNKNIVFINYLPVFLLGSFMGIIVYHLKKAKFEFSKYPKINGIIILAICISHAPTIYYRCLKGPSKSFWNLPLSNLSMIFCSGYALVLMLLNGKNFMTQFFELPLVSFLGRISYPAYLFHTIVREYMFKYYFWEKKFPDLFTCFIFTLILSYLIHITVEDYCIKYTKSWLLPDRKLEDLNVLNEGPAIINKCDYEKIEENLSDEKK